MLQADRRVDSAVCLPLSGCARNIPEGRASLPANIAAGTEARAPKSARAHSSAGQSYRLITGWSLVRIQVGPPYLLFISPDPTIFLKELFYGDYINVR
jgi:hypothetical protein